jgi:hypothetical protein
MVLIVSDSYTDTFRNVDVVVLLLGVLCIGPHQIFPLSSDRFISNPLLQGGSVFLRCRPTDYSIDQLLQFQFADNGSGCLRGLICSSA